MRLIARATFCAAAAALTVACADRATSSLDTPVVLDPAFFSAPIGFEGTTSSFAITGVPGAEFAPGERGQVAPSAAASFDFMGGGLAADFLGGPPAGHGRPFDRGEKGAPLGKELKGTCSFASGVTTCTDTHDGLTTKTTVTYKTAAGVAQQSFDALTVSVTAHSEVSGTKTSKDGARSTVVKHTSDQVVTGFAAPSVTRTVNGKSAGSEVTTGKDATGSFTASRTIGDTTTNLVVPVAPGKSGYPTAGTVVRVMTATVTYVGKAAVTSKRSETITYDGSATAKLVVTKDGVTTKCTVPLPHGRPTCS